MAEKKKTKVEVKKAVAKKTKITKKGNKVKVSLSKKAWIAVVVFVLIVAIVLTTLWFVKPEFFDFLKGDRTSGLLSEGVAEMHMIDVGQGDCILLRTNEVNIIIDAGGTTARDGVKASERIVKYINDLGIKTIDYMILTHTDADHTDYMDIVMANFEVKTIYLPDLTASYNEDEAIKGLDGKVKTKTYFEVVEAARAETYVEDGQTKQMEIKKNLDYFEFAGTGYRMKMFCYSAEQYARVTYGNATELNDVSPISIFEFGERKICLTGDAGVKAEEYFIEKAINKINVDILKVGHHGSRTSSSQKFIDFIDPEYAMVSCDDGEKHGHPDGDVIDRFKNYREGGLSKDEFDSIKQIYCTDDYGDIVAKIDANGTITFSSSIDYKGDVTVPPETAGYTPAIVLSFEYFPEEKYVFA